MITTVTTTEVTVTSDDTRVTVLLTAFTPMDPRSNCKDAPTAFTVEIPAEYVGTNLTAEEICQVMFDTTNLQQGPLWEHIVEPAMPANRSHTSLSVGDVVVVEGETFKCASFGWDRL